MVKRIGIFYYNDLGVLIIKELGLIIKSYRKALQHY